MLQRRLDVPDRGSRCCRWAPPPRSCCWRCRWARLAGPGRPLAGVPRPGMWRCSAPTGCCSCPGSGTALPVRRARPARLVLRRHRRRADGRGAAMRARGRCARSGLALVQTGQAAARFVCSLAFGAAWTAWGDRTALPAAAVALAVCVACSPGCVPDRAAATAPREQPSASHERTATACSSSLAAVAVLAAVATASVLHAAGARRPEGPRPRPAGRRSPPGPSRSPTQRPDRVPQHGLGPAPRRAHDRPGAAAHGPAHRVRRQVPALPRGRGHRRLPPGRPRRAPGHLPRRRPGHPPAASCATTRRRHPDPRPGLPQRAAWSPGPSSSAATPTPARTSPPAPRSSTPAPAAARQPGDLRDHQGRPRGTAPPTSTSGASPSPTTTGTSTRRSPPAAGPTWSGATCAPARVTHPARRTSSAPRSPPTAPASPTRSASRACPPDAPWRLYVLDLRTLRETPLAETRSVDDQAVWPDDTHARLRPARATTAPTCTPSRPTAEAPRTAS